MMGKLMKRISIIKYLSILLIVFTLIGILPIISKADEKDSDITMKVSYGISGTFKNFTTVPINIEIENNGADIDGQVEVRVPSSIANTYNSFIADVKIASKEKRTVIIPVNLSQGTLKLSAYLKEDKNVLKESDVYISTGRINSNDLFMGALTDDYNGLNLKELDFSDLNKSKNKDINQINCVPLNLNYLSKTTKNISQLDVIVINNFNMSSLQKDQYENLFKWVNDGGILVIGSGENASKTVGNIDKASLDVSYNGSKDTNGYTVSNLNVKDGEIKLKEGDTPLIYLMNKGRGKVYFSTFDLANKNIASKDIIMNAWKTYLGNDFISKNNLINKYNGRSPYEFQHLSSAIPIKEEFKIGELIIIFSLYVVIVGIILYFLMKKLKKREMLWIVIPIVAIAFSALLYVIGSRTRINDLVLNQVNIIESDKNGTGQTKGYVGIGSKYKDDLVVQEPNGCSIQEFNNDERHGSDIDMPNPTKLGTKTVYRENGSYYEFKDLSPLKMKNFEVSGHTQMVPQIETNLNYNSQKLNGKIKNTLGYDIEKILIVSQNSVWDLGSINAGEEKTVDTSSYFTAGLTQYSENLSEDYYKYESTGKGNKEDFKGIERISSLMRSVSQRQSFRKGTYLLAITDMPIDYGFDFGKKSISKFDTTAIIQNIDIDYTDSNGNLAYPLGYFKGVISKSDPNLHMNAMNNEIIGSGEVILDYSVGKDINLLDLKVGYVENKNRKTTAFKGDLYIYNFEKNGYEKIDYKADGESLNNPNEYIKDGKVTIKLEGKEEQNLPMPQIQVKGRAK